VIEQGFGEAGLVGEAVHVDPPVPRNFLLEDALNVVVGLAGMDRQGFAEADGETKLGLEGGLLDLAGAVVVVVIEAAFLTRVNRCARYGR
jgi:hypothetical protein